MPRTATIIDWCYDMFGTRWDIRESRPTSHGFFLQIGWPCDGTGRPLRGKRYGGPRVIPTRELHEYWQQTLLDRRGEAYDLPCGRSACKRVRHLLGINYYAAESAWWYEHLEELCDLTVTAFATKYYLRVAVVSKVRSAYFGPTLRPAGWWRTLEIAALLTSDQPLYLIAEQLQVAYGTVARLRHFLKAPRRTTLANIAREENISYSRAVQVAHQDNGFCIHCPRPLAQTSKTLCELHDAQRKGARTTRVVPAAGL